jgi:hypothetical protein
MKKTLFLLVLIFAILVSCNKNNKGNISQEANTENTENTENNNQNSIPPEMNTEIIEYKEDDINFSVGNISVRAPNDYAVTYWIEGEVVDLNNLDTTKLKYIKAFTVKIFRKDGNYEEPFETGVSILPSLTAYLDGTSQEKPKIYVTAMRRNKFKDINVCETLTLSRYVIDDTQFEHRIIFVDNEYCYIMETYFGGSGFDGEIRRELPDYFNEDGGFIRYPDICNQFANFQKMPDYIEELYAKSMRILNTMKINN